jgi:polysaccharide biosynthesis transport protein
MSDIPSNGTPVAYDPPTIPALPPMPKKTVSIAMSEGIGLADCWSVVRRSRRLILTLLTIALFLTAIVIFLTKPTYTASSTLLIEPEPAQVLDVRELISEGGSTEDHDYYKTQYDLIRSRDLAASVIRDLKLENTSLFASRQPSTYLVQLWVQLSSRIGRYFSLFSPVSATNSEVDGVSADLIDAYLKGLSVEPKVGTRLVLVSFTAPDPQLAATITNAHVKHYVNEGLVLHSESQRAAVDFLEEQLVDIKKRVERSEAALNTYRHEKGIVAFDVEDTNKVAQNRMEDLTKALTEAQTKRITAEAQMQDVRAGDYDSLPQVVTNPAITALKPQVRHLQAEYANMSTAFNPQYPKLAELKAELFEAQRTLDKETEGVAKAVQRDYTSANDQEQELRKEIDAEKERDLALNDASLQDAVLAREVEANRELYKNVLSRMEQIQVGEQAPVTNISVVDRAIPPSIPSSPKKKRDLAISGLLALMCGLILAFILDQLDNRLKTSEEVENYLHLPTLAVAPDFAMLDVVSGNHKLLSGLRRMLFGYGRIEGSAQNFVHQPGKGEVYRSIRTALMFSRAGAPPRKILVTSAIEGEGKTWTAYHTALAFAQTGARTLLIDADLRRAKCHESLDTDNTVGLSEVLVGQLAPKDAVRFIENRKLYLLPAGSPAPNPAELLTSQKMFDVLRSLSKKYHYILIDAAPLMYASDTVGIATMTDGVVLVAGAQTPKQSVLRASERLSLAGANVLGAVLNRVDITHPDHREYSRYYFSYQEKGEISLARSGDLETAESKTEIQP